MFNLGDAGKLAKSAAEGLQKAGSTGGTAKDVLEGVKSVVDLSGKAPEQVIAALRKLLAEAKQLAGSSSTKNAALDAGIRKAQTLLESSDITTEAVSKLTAELGALMKGAGTSKQPAGSEPQKPAASKTASAKPAAAQANVSPETPQSKPVEFSDVAAGAYYYDAVQWAVQKGIASGTTETTFSPGQDCTRAQTITLLWRAAGSPAPKEQNNPFSDVKDTAYYYQAALWAAERGIVSGTSFDPNAATTRGQMAAFLYRNAGSPAVEASGAFTDVPADAYYASAVAWVSKQGITSGTGEHTFSPDAACTRGQIVTFLYRANQSA